MVPERGPVVSPAGSSTPGSGPNASAKSFSAVSVLTDPSGCISSRIAFRVVPGPFDDPGDGDGLGATFEQPATNAERADTRVSATARFLELAPRPMTATEPPRHGPRGSRFRLGVIK